MIKLRMLFLLPTLFIVYDAKSQETEEKRRTIGLTAAFQTSQLDIMVPIWITRKIVIAPVVSALIVKDGGKDIGFGVVPKFYLKTNKLSPYIGLRIGGFLNAPKDDDNTLDMLYGVAFGGEYFFDRQFSIGVEAQGNAVKSAEKSNRFGNPGGFSINTGAIVTANVYF